MANIKLLAVFVLLICSTLFVDAKLTVKKNKVKPKKSKFTLKLSNNKKVTIHTLQKGADEYTFALKGKGLASLGFEASTVLFDFSGNDDAMVISAGKGKDASCFYTNEAPMSKQDMKQLVLGSKTKDDSDLTTVVFDARGAAKNKKDAMKWLKKMPSARKLCKKAEVVEMTRVPDNEIIFGVKKHFLWLGNIMEVVSNFGVFNIQPRGGASGSVGGVSSNVGGASGSVGGVSSNVGVTRLGVGGFSSNVGGASNGGSGTAGNSKANKNNNKKKNNKKNNKNKNNKNKNKQAGTSADVGGASSNVGGVSAIVGGASTGGSGTGDKSKAKKKKNAGKKNNKKNNKNKNKQAVTLADVGGASSNVGGVSANVGGASTGGSGSGDK